jgi:hypothetical protein
MGGNNYSPLHETLNHRILDSSLGANGRSGRSCFGNLLSFTISLDTPNPS